MATELAIISHKKVGILQRLSVVASERIGAIMQVDMMAQLVLSINVSQ